jgi:lipopolysaccharide export system permease protein
MKLSIWKQYFCLTFLQMFFLFLICFYGIYVLVDYASQTSTASGHPMHIQWMQVIRYYFYVFASRAEILIPLALLIAFIYTTTSLNVHRELVAFMASGFPLKKLMRPFVAIALACVFLMYANEQFILPHAMAKLRHMEGQSKHKRKRNLPEIVVHQTQLQDGSLLIYQEYDTQKEQFFDVYWIQSMDSIYRMKTLSFSPPKIPTGFFVDHITRNANGELMQNASYPEFAFPDIAFQRDISAVLLEPETFSLSNLAKEAKQITTGWDEKESKIMTTMYWKMIIPWLCLLAVLAPAPFCTQFSRLLPVFFIYICALFGLIAFYMLLDAGQVVSKRQVLDPIWTILTPFTLVFGYFAMRFYRLDCRG